MASLDKICPKCGFTITPDLVRRVDFDLIECPECGEKFQPGSRSLNAAGDSPSLSLLPVSIQGSTAHYVRDRA